MGCAVAHRLLEAGWRVTLLERSLPGAESSAAAAGILGAQSEVSEDGPFLELCLASRERYRQFARELEEATDISVGYEASGVLEVALNPAEGRLAAGRAEWMLARGLRVELLDREEARRLEPALTTAMVGANFYPEDHQVDPVALSRAQASLVARLGGKFLSGSHVQGVAVVADRVEGVRLGGATLGADVVVVAGGAWSTLLDGLPPLRTWVKPMSGQILQWITRPPLFRHVVYGYKGYVVPRADGRVLLGSTLEDRGFDKAVTAAGLNRIVGMGLELVPALGEARWDQAWAGLRPSTGDGRPILGRGPLAGLFFATGHFRNGILLAPITGEIIRDLVTGRDPGLDLTPFAP
ncbi:MAG: glycine oxidase ThiO [Magnetococcales bacterium]|nr:glycine oxidase ThiO [Magnetococcales bacterium]MBF0155849.1 glycine oxidase ThiO [Magnetococcales bacterium]